MQDFIEGTALMFYELNEEMQEKMNIEKLISAFNVKELTFETDQLGEQNVHEMDMNTLETVLAIALSKEDSDFDRVFIKLLKIRLDELIKEKVRQKSYLIESYGKGELRWMDDPFNKFISEMNIGLLNNNLTRLRDGYYKEECKGLDEVWIEILEKELKTKKQAKAMESKMWPSSDGPIHVEKMSKTHINNCIQRMDNKTKKGFFEFTWLRIFYAELARREEEKRLLEVGRQILIAYKSNDLRYAYTDEDNNLIVAFVHEMPLSHLRAGLLYTSEGGYNAQWPEIFKMEIGKREEEIRQIIKSISYASAYGTTGTLLSEYCVCILNLSLLGNFNRI